MALAAKREEERSAENRLSSPGLVVLADVIIILAVCNLLKSVHTLLTPGLFSPCQRLEIRNRTKMRKAKT
jgi:hypothetical protein